jgi:NADPH:quinone reductase-like Zn-dependent oxidoreductase
VDALGANVTQFSEGDEVYAMSFLRSSNGSYAQFVCVPVELVAKKPRHLTFEEAASVPLAAMTAYRATSVAFPCRPEDTVFIAGVGGGVGSFALQFIRLAGVRSIFTVAKDEKSATFLQEMLGISRDHILLYEGFSTDQLREKLLQMNSGRLFDFTLDLAGGEMKRLCLELTGYSGHFSTVLPEKDFQFPVWNEHALPRARNMSIHQVSVGAELSDDDRKYWKVYQRHLELLSEMFDRGDLRSPFINIVGMLAAPTVIEAHRRLEEGRVKGKLVMVVNVPKR